MVILDLIWGLLLVLAGRRLFWLCVGIVGFLVGVQCAGTLGLSNGWVAISVAIAAGCLGIVLATTFEWFMAVFVVGFLGGGYLLMNICPFLVPQGSYSWPIFIVGGIVGMCLMVITLDFTLIIISSLLGAMLIAHAFPVTGDLREPLLIGSLLIGIMVQYLTLKHSFS